MTVTNLRLPKSSLLQIKALAGEAQMSFNDYMKYIINIVIKAKELAVGLKDIPLNPSKHDPIWDLPDIAKKIGKKPMGLSPDDEIIYG